ncbi:hypothetical protein BDA96_10G196900 [Sorghum bicolor]|uniref:Uncharacterized protein n=2 Tax=Sorghum bicolor TaxID=4558 RepID=A0A921U1G1_SORBI|nr:hypothetical protein BDA96_10G196900 [Sorghum bicolor]KXG20070.1 hypothetical protein SORBI_3010G150600 [Sorghum bicolor]
MQRGKNAGHMNLYLCSSMATHKYPSGIGNLGTYYSATLHEYGYEYPIQYVSDTRIHTFSKENPLKWCIRVSVSAYPTSIGYGYVTSLGVSV